MKNVDLLVKLRRDVGSQIEIAWLLPMHLV